MGEKGWAPLCFLNGNPVFNTFDKFQAFVQGTISGLATFMGEHGVKNPYGPSIILFTCMIRLILLPLAYKQTQSSQATQALSPKVAEIKEKFPDDKDMQTQLTALLYEKSRDESFVGLSACHRADPSIFGAIPLFPQLGIEKRNESAFPMDSQPRRSNLWRKEY